MAKLLKRSISYYNRAENRITDVQQLQLFGSNYPHGRHVKSTSEPGVVAIFPALEKLRKDCLEF